MYPIFREKTAMIRGFTLVEVLVGIVIGAVLILGVLQFSRGIVGQSTVGKVSGTMEQELSRFQALMLTDLARAGNDVTGGDRLRAYQTIQGSTCENRLHEFGLVEFPGNSQCTEVWGIIGILSYQGVDVNRDGKMFPEEGVDYADVRLRPSTAQASAPVNTYNDFIVYDWNIAAKTVTRKNIGDPTTTDGDYSEVVLRNVARFSIQFRKTYDPDEDVKPTGDVSRNSGVTVSVSLLDNRADPSYANPNFTSDSPHYHYRTADRSFTFDVIDTALCVN